MFKANREKRDEAFRKLMERRKRRREKRRERQMETATAKQYRKKHVKNGSSSSYGDTTSTD